MNYVLVSLGKTPNHLKSCIQQIINVDSNKPIFLITDQNIQNYFSNKLTIINANELKMPDIGNYFKYDSNPLWYTSLLRVFYLNAFLQIKKEPLIHFDNDVLVYYSANIANNLTQDGVYLTPHKTTEYTFGYSVIKNIDKFSALTEKIYDTVLQGEQKIRSMLDQPHEMRLLGYCGKDIITPLNVHPYTDPSCEYIFDPSSYGQFVDGTPNGHSSGFIDPSQFVGEIFTRFTPQVIFNNKRPILVFNNKEYKIFNLHIHSKRLSLYET
jgi:hypothetical protein